MLKILYFDPSVELLPVHVVFICIRLKQIDGSFLLPYEKQIFRRIVIENMFSSKYNDFEECILLHYSEIKFALQFLKRVLYIPSTQ